MLKYLRVLAAVAFLPGSAAAGANDPGFMRVEDALVLDAGTPVFQFTTFEIRPGASVRFTGLEAGDTLTLFASEAIRIGGTIILAPAGGLRLEAPIIEIGAGVTLDLSGGTLTLAGGGAGSGTTTPGAGAIVVSSGTDLSLDSLRYSVGHIAGNDGSVRVDEPRGVITLQSPVPEPRAWALLGMGLALVGFAARRGSRA